jgi:TIR domain
MIPTQIMATGAQSGNENSKSLSVFLCHSSADKALVRELCVRLESNGVQPWLDEKNLLGGQDFQQEIRRAVRASDVVVICLSNSSTTKSGFVQREIKYAMELAEEQPEGALFLIPLRLEECNVPQSLNKLHWIDYFKADGYQHLRRALDFRAQTLKKNPTTPSEYTKTENASGESQRVGVRIWNTALHWQIWVYAMGVVFLVGSGIVAFENYVRNSTLREARVPQVDSRNLLRVGRGETQTIMVPRNGTLNLSTQVNRESGDFTKYTVLILGPGKGFSLDCPISPDGMIAVSVPPGLLEAGNHSLVVQGVKSKGETVEISRVAFSVEFSD